MIRLPPRATLFPDTTLFRSAGLPSPSGTRPIRGRWRSTSVRGCSGSKDRRRSGHASGRTGDPPGCAILLAVLRRRAARSEEHTSELPSRQYLVCRLLLATTKWCSPFSTLPGRSYTLSLEPTSPDSPPTPVHVCTASPSPSAACIVMYPPPCSRFPSTISY